MPLRDRPEFQTWLARFDERHVTLHGEEPPSTHCEGCGEPIARAVAAAGLCMVCLAESYGLERGHAAGRVAGILEAALLCSADAQITDVRDAVEDVLERYERASGRATEG